MPMIVPAVAAAVTWVSSAAAIATGFLAAPLVGLVGEGAAIAIAGAGLKLTATALGSLALNAVLAPRVGSAGSPTSFKADPSSPIRGVMGYFGTGGTQAHMRVWGKDNLMISYMVILSLGPIQGVSKFEANELQVNFPLPNGEAARVEPYRDKMWMTYKMGLPTDGALGPPPVGGNPRMEWDNNHRTSGYAGAFWTMQNNSKKASYESGVPKPLWTLYGQLLYDPRFDSTQTAIGGSGPQRLNDWRTWGYNENPQVHAYNWALGHYKKLEDGSLDRKFLLAGVGARPDKIDLTTFVAGMNVSDANGWKISGEWNSQDDKWQTLSAMLQAGGSAPVHVGAKIGIMTNAPKVPVATITSADVLGNMNIKVMASRRDRFNTVYPRYLNESQNWDYSTAGAVTSTVYSDQDGGEERPKELTYNYVRLSLQAGQLAAYDLANTRESLKLAFPAKPYLVGVKPGDAVLVNDEAKGLVNQKFIVTARPIELMEGTVGFELRSETDSKHSWALGQTDRPAPSPALSPINPIPSVPDDGGWVLVPPAPGTPSVGVGIDVPDGIGRVVVEFAEVADDTVIIDTYIPEGSSAEPGMIDPEGLYWETSFDGPPTTAGLTVSFPKQNAWYYVRVKFLSVSGVPSPYSYKGPVNSGFVEASKISEELLEEIKAGISDGDSEFEQRLDDLDSALNQLGTIVDQANSSFDAALAGLDSQVSGLQSGLASVNTSLDGKATTSQLNFQINRIDNQAATIGSLVSTVNDIPNQYVSATSYNTLLSEVVNARGSGNPSLSARFSQQSQALVDGLAGKVSTTTFNNLNATVSTLNGTVSSHSSRLDSVEAALPGKASAQSVSNLSSVVSNKSRIFVQPTTPTGGQLNDLWIHTGDGRKLYYFDGSSWTFADDTNVAGFMSATISRLDSTDVEIGKKASASTVESLRVQVEGQVADIQEAKSLSIDASGKVNAMAGLRIVSGNIIAGWQTEINGPVSSFNIRSDIFSLTPSSGTGARTAFANGKWTIWNSAGIDVVQLGINVNG